MNNQNSNDDKAISLFSEIMAADQMIRAQLAKSLPKGLELSHFSVLNNLAYFEGERSPAELARIFNVTKGAMTNTLKKLEMAGYIHIRQDWDDARRKCVAISGAGRLARDSALASINPLFEQVADRMGVENMRKVLPLLRSLRSALS